MTFAIVMCYPKGMPRIARAVVPGIPFHITQRGNNKQDVFFVDEDRRHFLTILAAQAERFGLDVHGYCLMRNHVHLIATPRTEESMAKALGRTCLLYALYINRLHGRSGHLWQSRYYSCALDDEHYLAAMRYVERNPVRARLVRVAARYPWSSAAFHVDPSVAGALPLAEGPVDLPAAEWAALLTEPDQDSLASDLRGATLTGRPLGGDSFVAKIEVLLGRRLRALSHGRPAKTKTTSGRKR